jgi:hypothetical protein
MEDCTYIWCKACQQEIVPNGTEHSCDGSSELKHLVEQQGWKFCPSKSLSSGHHRVRDNAYVSVQHAVREDFRVQLSFCKLSDVTRQKESELILHISHVAVHFSGL